MLKQYKLRNYHFQLVISILVLNIIGILIIGSAKHSVQKMQILGCIIGMVAMGHCILDGLFLYSEIYLVVLYRNHCPAWSGYDRYW